MKRVLPFIVLSIFFIVACSEQIGKKVEEKDLQISPEAVQTLETAADLDVLIEDIGNKRIVLLGEATHGTSEFYTWRAEISKRLIIEKGFDIIAVEADWEDAYAVNQYIKGKSNYATAAKALNEFDRWPQWMWKNQEIADLAEWLKAYNSHSPGDLVGFYGLDVYGIWESLEELVSYLDKADPATAVYAREVVKCFAPFEKDEQAYAASTVNSSENCKEELAELLKEVEQSPNFKEPLNEKAYRAYQNLKVVVNAEDYYRTAAINYPMSWNVRDHHMTEILSQLLERGGEDAKIIVWEHNTHIGDARATDMARAGMVNVGHLVREQYSPQEVYIVGFGTYKGKVIAATSWGSPPQKMTIPSAKRNSWEWILHNHEATDKIIFTNKLSREKYTGNYIGHRAIGVVYNPGEEKDSYVPTILPDRYDAFIYIDNSNALNFLR